MSRLPLPIRAKAALGQHLAFMDRFEQHDAADAAMGDAGDFSKTDPNWAKVQAHRAACLSRWHVTDESLADAETAAFWGDDPMGAWHGRNE